MTNYDTCKFCGYCGKEVRAVSGTSFHSCPRCVVKWDCLERVKLRKALGNVSSNIPLLCAAIEYFANNPNQIGRGLTTAYQLGRADAYLSIRNKVDDMEENARMLMDLQLETAP